MTVNSPELLVEIPTSAPFQASMSNANAMKASTRTKEEDTDEAATETERKTMKEANAERRSRNRLQGPQLGFTHNGNAITYTKGNKDDTNKSPLIEETDIKGQRKNRKRNCLLNLCQRLNTGTCWSGSYSSGEIRHFV